MVLGIGFAIVTWFLAAGLLMEIHTDIKYPIRLNVYIPDEKKGV